ncbi:hypothetical protein HD554DRAFT_2041506 [Boletus coccyginus]|nr:hypothetical protein HD554DRAFT_2041506 [Boletus coccyginus]
MLRYLTSFLKFIEPERLPSESESGIHIDLKHAHTGRETQHGAIAAKVPPEVILMILHEIPRPHLPPVDVFTFTTPSASPSRSHILDIALVSAPLVCMSWHSPATAVLYENIVLRTREQCEILYCTLQSNPFFGSWVKALHLPCGRGRAITDPHVLPPGPAIPITPDDRLLQLSINIFKACDLVQEVDIFMAQANPSKHAYLRSIRVTDINSILGNPRATHFFALQELTLDGFHFDGSQTHLTIHSIWPELSQLKCLEELWIEDVWQWSFESTLPSYESLRTVHVDWDIFFKMAPFFPIGIQTISVTVPVSTSSSAPAYGQFEASLLRQKVPIAKRCIGSGEELEESRRQIDAWSWN